MNTSNQLTHTISNSFFHRPRIQHILDNAFQKNIVLLVAGTGYGKTSETHAYLGKKENIFWIQFSKMDNIDALWWDRFLIKHTDIIPESIELLYRCEIPTTTFTFLKYIDALESALNKNKHYYFVFDDFHILESSSILGFFENFLNLKLPNITIVMLAKQYPAISLLRQDLSNLVSNVDESDLKFSLEETFDYFTALNPIFSKIATRTIYEQTGGWNLAIYLTALRIHRCNEIDPLAVITSDIFLLFESELFSQTTPETQKMLIKLSFIDHLPFNLLETLCYDCPSFFNSMDKLSGVFRRRINSTSYKFHYFFKKFLNSKWDKQLESDLVEIHKKAGIWFLQNNFPIDAINHYAEIKAYPDIVEALLTWKARVPASYADFAIKIIDAMPEDFKEQNIMAQILRLRFLINNFLLDNVFSECSNLISKITSQPATEENLHYLGELNLLQGFCSWMNPKSALGSATFLTKAAELLAPDGTSLFTDDLHLNPGIFACSISSFSELSLPEFIAEMEVVYFNISKITNGCGNGLSDLMKAEIAFYQKNIQNATIFAHTAYEKGLASSQFDVCNMSIFYLIRIQFALGNYTKIQKLLKQLLEPNAVKAAIDAYRGQDMVIGWFYSTIGLTDKVPSWIYGASTDFALDSPIISGYDVLVKAKALIADKRFPEILAYFETMTSSLSYQSFLLGSVDIGVLKAIAYYRMGDIANAVTTLEQTYSISCKHDLIMPFAEGGNDMRSLANYICKKSDLNHSIPREWLEYIQTIASTYAKKQSFIRNELTIASRAISPKNVLSQRETSVLLDICHGLSRDEIAVNNQLSINTIKSIITSIYTKLEVANAIEAVRVATLRGII